jgi:hypothetical protein
MQRRWKDRKAESDPLRDLLLPRSDRMFPRT